LAQIIAELGERGINFRSSSDPAGRDSAAGHKGSGQACGSFDGRTIPDFKRMLDCSLAGRLGLDNVLADPLQGLLRWGLNLL
jgi:hypothetical protein